MPYEDLCEDVTPDLAGLLDLAITHHQNGRLAEAERLYSEIRQSDSDHFEATHLLGTIRHQQGRNQEAVELIAAALESSPQSAPALVNLGAALSVLGRHEEALAKYDAALVVAPNWAEALLNRGNALLELKRFEEALVTYDRVIEIRPNYPAALDARGRALLELRRPNDALASFEKVLALAPDHANALFNRGNALVALAQQDEATASYDRALASYDEAIAHKPDHAEALYSTGVVLMQMNKPQKALARFDRALGIRSDYAEALCGRGNALRELDRAEDALASYDAALTVHPDHIETLCNRGNALAAVNRLQEALASYDRALEVDGDNADLRFNRAYLLLLLGRFGEGWHEHEWRRRRKSWVERQFAGPEWAGEDIRGKRVLLYTEQGMGDTIQFARFARLVAQRGANIILEVQPRLTGLLQTLEPDVVIVRRGSELPEFDCHLPLMSVPSILGFEPERSRTAVPYLSADPIRIAHWASRLPAGGFRVGIVWQGNASGPIDKGRSIPLRAFAPLGRIPGVKLFSLQKGAGKEQVADLPLGMSIETLGTDFDTGTEAFLDTAAILMNLDLIVTSDTAVAHLAGALGRPVWIVLKHVPDWRWMMGREDSPWYPTVRLFRQGRAGDWDKVFARIATELAALAAGSARVTKSDRTASKQQIDEVSQSTLLEERSDNPSRSEQPCAEPKMTGQPRAGFSRMLDKAIALHQQGKFDEAELLYLTILASQPDHLDATHLLGLIRHQQGRDLEALELIGSVLKRIPDSAPALTNQGAVLHRLGRREEAVASYDRALAIRPDDAKTLCNRGIALRELNRVEEAQASFEHAVAAAPHEWEAHVGLADALKARGRLEQAVASWKDAEALNPHHAEMLNDLGNALMALGRLDEAVETYRRALAIRPEYAAAWTNLGAALAEKGEAVAAEAAHRRALAQSPSLVEAHANLVVALGKQDKFEEAITAAKHALELAPNFAALHFALGYALKEQGDIDAALAAYRQALELQPEFPEGHFNLAFALLLKRHDPEGWREYEWRWKGGVKGKVPRRLSGPQWQGEDLAGRALLLYAEQGRGDTLQFARFVPHLTARGARVLLEAPRSLVALLECSDFAESIVATGERLPNFDFHLPLLSVPAVLGMSEEAIPGSIPYLAADPARVMAWKARLGDHGFRIGVAWQGEPNAKVDIGRSFPLRALAPVAALPGVRLISLQKHHGLEQIATLPDGFRVQSLEPDFDSGPDAFLDTAAVMMSLDLIITSDTAVAHLAGALGRPVWIALKRVPDWRWQLDRKDSPWYPTARLFRQTRAGNWDEVFERIAGEVARLGTERASRPSDSAVASIPVPVGELIDKITILRIKGERIADPKKLANVQRELTLLDEVRRRCSLSKDGIAALETELETINSELWDIEDRIRDCEHKSDFGAEFIALARAVYMTNDRRSAVKRRISELAGSTLIEEKSYH
jgi:tetratricopeptide (TPR) repeat protein